MPISAAPKLEPDAVFQETATVARRDGDAFLVVTPLSELRARRARSCLVAPEAGDRVIVATTDGGEAWVLAVLEGASPLVVQSEGDMAIRSTGRLDLTAHDTVGVVAGEGVAVTAGRVEVKAIDAAIAFDRLTQVGQQLLTEVDRIKTVARTFDGVFDRLSQRMKRSFRRVEQIDQVKAGHVDYAADGTMSLRSDHTVMTAERLVKVDGKQVHLG